MYEHATAALEIAQESGYQIWHALALVLQGTAMTGLGQTVEGHLRAEQGVALYQGMKTPPVFWPLVLYLRANASARAGRLEEGLALLDQAIEMQLAGFLRPELLLLKGDLLLAAPDHDSAESWFQRAFDVAERQGLHMSQLRAATRLTRLRRAAGRDPDSADVLRSVYQTFTEGFDTADLADARALLFDGDGLAGREGGAG
jgi:tetratricopeptide (TPR) repeat protein